MGKFSSRLPRSLGRKNRDLGNRASPALHMSTSIFFTKKRVARRDLGNRASPVDRVEEVLSVVKPTPKLSFQQITKDADNTVNQSKLEEITCR